MKNLILKKMLLWGIVGSLLLSLCPAVLAEVAIVDLEKISEYKQTFTPVDIKGVTNRGFADDVPGDGKGGWADQGPMNDMSCFTKRGLQKFAGIEFDIINPNENDGKSAIVLRGQNDTSVPNEMIIPVGKKCKGMYFLHTSPWLNNDEPVGSYTIQYDDGTESIVEIQAGQQVFNWWNTSKSKHAVIGWVGNNESSAVSLGILPVENPNPDKVIKQIVAKTIGVGPYLVIVGITLTDAGPYLPLEKEVNIGNPNTSDWYPYIPCEEPELLAGTPIDASGLLEAPAGKHGHVKTEGDKFVFEDGTPIQFWGVAVAGEAMFMNQEDAEKTAQRIAQLGFNFVRFHILSANSQVKVGVDLTDTTMRKTGRLSTKNMNQLCYFMNELKKRGIYYGFDMLTSSIPTWKNNNYHDIPNLKSSIKGPNWFDPEIIKLFDSVAEQFITYENPYSGMAIGDDPSAVFASLYNETSINQLKEFSWEYYYPELKELYNEWLRKKYPTRSDLELAWTDTKSDQFGLLEGEDQTKGTVDCYAQMIRKKSNNKRFADNLEFLGEIERSNYRTRIDRIKEYAPKLLVQGSTTFTSGSDDIGSLFTAAKEGDFYSQQNYLFLAFGNGERMEPGTLIGKPETSLKNTKFGIFGIQTGRKVFGAPYFMTEWDGSLPNPYRSELWLMMGALACTQYWNPVLFAWSDFKFSERLTIPLEKKRINGTHELGNRGDTLYTIPAVSYMINRHDVTESKKGYFPLRLQGKEVYQKANQFTYNDASYTMVGKSGIFMDKVVYDPNYNDNDMMKLVKYGQETGKYISNTDETIADIDEKIFKVNTERSQCATGFLGGTEIELNDVKYQIKNDFATVYLTSLSKDNIHDADSLLMTLVGDARNYGQKMTDDGTTVVLGGTGPVMIEPIKGTITLKSKDSYKVYPLDFTGHRKGEVPTHKDQNGFTVFNTTAADKTMNYEIVRTEKSNTNFENEKISYLPTDIFKDCFNDLGEWEPYKKEIERIYMQGFMREIAPNKFYPNQPITRDMAVSLILGAVPFNSEEDAGFADVTKENPYYAAICSAKKYEIISGDMQNNFRPNDFISMEDFLYMTYRAISQTEKMRKDEKNINVDLSNVSDYAKKAVAKMIKLGYCEGIDKLNLKESITRGGASVLLYRILWE